MQKETMHANMHTCTGLIHKFKYNDQPLTGTRYRTYLLHTVFAHTAAMQYG